MPIAGSGPVSISNVSSIVKGSLTAQTSLNESLVRQLAGAVSGSISLSNFRNKPVAGSTTYNTPGTYTFICPVHENITVDVRGAGGGGGGGGTNFVFTWAGNPGTNGGNSSFGSSTSVLAGGGFGGNGGCGGGPGGGNGTGSGGVNQGSSGGVGGTGGSPNGGCTGQAGGTGNRQTKSWTFITSTGHLVWGTSYTVVVGRGGTGGNESSAGGGKGTAGANGSVIINWS